MTTPTQEYRLRRLAWPDDCTVVADVANAHTAGHGDDGWTTSDLIANEYAHLTNSDLDTDFMFAETTDSGPVGYVRVAWWDSDGEKRVYGVIARADPAHPAAARLLLDWAEPRCVEIARSHDDCRLRKVLWSFAHEPLNGGTAIGVTAELRERGYEAIEFECDMVRSGLDGVPDVPLPAGLDVRPVRSDDLRVIWEADNEAFRDHWDWSEPTEEDYEKFVGFPYRDESLWQVAWDGDRVAGQVRTFVNGEENRRLRRHRAWTEFISTGREWRRRGLARALICRSLRDLAERGFEEAALGVHVDNPNGAFGLYDSLGYRRTALLAVYERSLGA